MMPPESDLFINRPLFLLLLKFGLAALGMGIWVLARGVYRHGRQGLPRTHLAFFGFSLAIFIWHLGNAQLLLARDEAEAWFWWRFAACGFCFYQPLIMHFALQMALPNRYLLRRTVWLLYLPGLVFFAMAMEGGLFLEGFRAGPFGWYERIDHAHPLYMAFFYIYVYGYIAITVAILRHASRATRLKREKCQYRLLARSSFVSLGGGIVFMALHAAVLQEIPMVVCLFALPFTIGTGIAIVRYSFLSIGPADLFHTIINHVHELVIFVDDADQIRHANAAVHATLGYPEGALPGMPAERVIDEYRAIREAGEALIKKPGLENDGTLTLVAAAGVKIAAPFYQEPVLDRFGDRRGLLFVGSIVKQQLTLFEEYAITDQERRILSMLIRGCTLRRIAAEFGITPGTVKNHVYHIYRKTGVSSRVELVRLFRKP